MTNPTFDALSAAPISVSLPPISTTPGVIQSGTISGKNGLKEAFTGALRSKHIKDQIIRIVANDLTGLIGILYGRYITGARISQQDISVEGLDAIWQLLNLQTGNYDLLHIEKEILTRKLKQSLGLDLQSILDAAQFNPDADLIELFEQQAAARLISEPVKAKLEDSLFHEVVRPVNDDSVLKLSLSLARELFPQPPSGIFGNSAENISNLACSIGGELARTAGGASPSSGRDEISNITKESAVCQPAAIDSGCAEASTSVAAPESSGVREAQDPGEAAPLPAPSSIKPAVRAGGTALKTSHSCAPDSSEVVADDAVVASPSAQLLQQPQPLMPKVIKPATPRHVLESASEQLVEVDLTTVIPCTSIEVQVEQDLVEQDLVVLQAGENPALAVTVDTRSEHTPVLSRELFDGIPVPSLDELADLIASSYKSAVEPVGQPVEVAPLSEPEQIATSSPKPVLQATDTVAATDIVTEIAAEVTADTVLPAQISALQTVAEPLSSTQRAAEVAEVTEVTKAPADDTLACSSSDAEPDQAPAPVAELPPVNYVVVPDARETVTTVNEDSSVNFVIVKTEEAAECVEPAVVEESRSGYDLDALNAIPTPGAKPSGIVATQNQKMVVLQDLEATLTRARSGSTTGQFKAITSERLKPSPGAVPPPGPSATDTARLRTGEFKKPQPAQEPSQKRAGSQSYQKLRQQTPGGSYKETSQLYIADLQKKMTVDNKKFVETGKQNAISRPLDRNMLAIAAAVCVIICFAVGVRLIMGANESLSAADAKLRAGDSKGAAEIYSRIIQNEPVNPAAYAGRAAATANTAAESSLADYEKALDLKPDATEIRVKYAALLFKQGRGPEALSQANSVLNREPENPGAHLVIGMCQSRMGKFEEAIPSLEIAFKSNVGSRAEVCHYLYEACLHCKRKPEASLYIDEAIKVAPQNARYLLDRARLKVSDGNFVPARKDLMQAVTIAPLNAECRYLLGICDYEQHLIRPAIANWTEALNRGYNPADVLLHRGHAYLELGQYHQALADLEQYLQFKPDDREALNHRNVALFQSRRRMPVVATVQSEQVVRRPVQFKGDAVNAGYNALRAKDSTSAISILNEAVKVNPDNPMARKYLAYAHLREGNVQSAVRQFQAWNYLQPVPTKEMWHFAKTSMGAGKYGEAAQVYEEIVKSEPSNTSARIQLIKACSLAGDNEKARALCLEAMTSAKNPHDYQRFKVLMP